MNRISTFFSIVLISIWSYSTKAQSIKTDTTKYVAKPSTGELKKLVVTTHEIESGKQLLLRSDCSACHTVQNKLVGPSYIEIVEKYPLTNDNINMLSQKIIKGGSGIWGKIPMAPHPALTDADAKKIVKYLLSEF